MKKLINQTLIATILLGGVGVTSTLVDSVSDNSITASASTSSALTLNKSYYTQDELSLRKGAGISNKKILDIPVNKKVLVTAKKKVSGTYWYKTTYKNKKGWVSGKYLKSSKKVSISKVSNSITTSAVNSNSLNDNIIENGKKFLGVKYVWGASANSGMDCSGFVYRTLNASGISVPRYDSRQFYAVSKKISYSQLEKGDLVFFATNGGSRISHIAIYMGDDKLIHAYGKGVQISSFHNGYWDRLTVGYGRIK